MCLVLAPSAGQNMTWLESTLVSPCWIMTLIWRNVWIICEVNIFMRCKNDEITVVTAQTGCQSNDKKQTNKKKTQTSYFVKSIHSNAHVDVCACVCMLVRVRRSVKRCVKIASVPLKFQHLLPFSYGCSDIISPDLIRPNGARGAIRGARGASSEGSPT